MRFLRKFQNYGFYLIYRRALDQFWWTHISWETSMRLRHVFTMPCEMSGNFFSHHYHLEGGTLKAYLEKNHGDGQGKDFSVRFLEDIGSAIEHLHSLNIIHRDVKPENIFVSLKKLIVFIIPCTG